jgi:hypothetical protein
MRPLKCRKNLNFLVNCPAPVAQPTQPPALASSWTCRKSECQMKNSRKSAVQHTHTHTHTTLEEIRVGPRRDHKASGLRHGKLLAYRTFGESFSVEHLFFFIVCFCFGFPIFINYFYIYLFSVFFLPMRYWATMTKLFNKSKVIDSYCCISHIVCTARTCNGLDIS